jgi:hypothetical protein
VKFKYGALTNKKNNSTLKMFAGLMQKTLFYGSAKSAWHLNMLLPSTVIKGT